MLCFALLALVAVALFGDRETVPVILWDESRVAVNALELYLDGWSVVTTFGREPDLWNTKPPLLVWLISGSFAIFGPSEFALRLPSMIAALATLAIVFGFTLRHTKKRYVAALATAILGFSIIFFGEQGARTADYGALLTLLTTAYLMFLFEAVHRQHPATARISIIASVAALALMTKGIAAIIPAVGVPAYLVLFGRWRRVLTDWRYCGLGLIALLPLAIFLVLREQAAPGFAAVSFFNDVGGRFNQSLGLENRAPLFYVDTLFTQGLFFLGPWTLLVPLALLKTSKRSRIVLGFALCCAAGQIFLLSFAQTRLVQYALPAAPWLAIAAAIAIGQVIEEARLLMDPGRKLRAIVAVAGCAMIVQQGTASYIHARYTFFPSRQFYPEAGYGVLFAQLYSMKVRKVTVVRSPDSYAPQLQFYRTLWAARGLVIEVTPAVPSHGAVASCEPVARDALSRSGATAARFAGCYFHLETRVEGGTTRAQRNSI